MPESQSVLRAWVGYAKREGEDGRVEKIAMVL